MTRTAHNAARALDHHPPRPETHDTPAPRRTNPSTIQLRGPKAERPTTPPFSRTVLNDLDRSHHVRDTLERVPQAGPKGEALKQQLQAKLVEHRQYIDTYGEDLPEIRNWTWRA